jgi:hypothetical protein
MNTNLLLKEKAIRLRLLGNTYSEINTKLPKNIPKSTLSVWFKNLKFTKSQNKKLKNHVLNKITNAQKIAVEVTKQAKINRLNALRDKNIYILPLINIDVQKIMLSILYLGEGSKSKSSDTMTLGSTNPDIIKLYLTLLENCFKIDKSKFRVRIQCRADQNIKEIERYWGKITGISSKQFYPTYIDKRTIGKPTLKTNYRGMCAIIYFDRSVQYELELLYESMLKYILKGR